MELLGHILGTLSLLRRLVPLPLKITSVFRWRDLNLMGFVLVPVATLSLGQLFRPPGRGGIGRGRFAGIQPLLAPLKYHTN